ncbi:MAG: hypothetical protein KIT43_09350 [Bauldia sp.]|nr:hypothetical protein [Bauldia sp.]MCW5717579.1 hypothetical protein [Bauldia sp.]
MTDIPVGEPSFALYPRLREVTARLVRARRLALIGALAEALAMAVAAGLVTWCLLRLAVAILWIETSAATLASASVTVAGLALAMATISAIAEGPSLAALARRADATFLLDERISTAVEVADGPSTPVTRALLADAEGRARAILPGAILGGRTAGLAFPLLGLALLAALLLLAPLPPAASAFRPGPPTASVVLGMDEATTLAGELRAIATTIAADAARRDDAFLAAIAAEIGETAQRLEAGEPVERAAIGEDLARLGDYAAMAYERGGDPAAPVTALSRLAAATAAGTAPRTGPGSAPNGGTPAAPADPLQLSPAAPPVPAGDPAMPGQADPAGPEAPATPLPETGVRATPAAEITGDAVQEPCNFDAGGDCAVAAGENPFGLERGNVNMPPDPGGAAPPNAPEGPAMAEGQLIGPAADAGAGEAVFAGQGTRPLGETPGDDPGTLDDGGAMLLPDRGTGTGDRIRLDMPPPPGGAILIEGALPPGVAWRVLTEVEVARTLLPPAEREIAGRYFDRPAGGE